MNLRLMNDFILDIMKDADVIFNRKSTDENFNFFENKQDDIFECIRTALQYDDVSESNQDIMAKISFKVFECSMLYASNRARQIKECDLSEMNSIEKYKTLMNITAEINNIYALCFQQTQDLLTMIECSLSYEMGKLDENVTLIYEQEDE